MLQDRQGFMWFGTQDGLNKYDGHTFTIYRRNENDEQTLLDNYILTLFEDRAGRIWIGTNKGGLSRYEPETETFTHFLHDPNNPRSLSLNTITTILEDANGMLWVGTDGGGLNHFDPRTNQATRYQYSPDDANSLSHNIIRGMYQDRAGILWLGTKGGMTRFDPATRKFTRYQHDPQRSDSLSHNLVIAITEDEAGKLWLATANGLNVFDRATEQFKRFLSQPTDDTTLSHSSATSVLRDHAGTMWVGTGRGLNRYESATQQFTRALSDPDDPSTLSADGVYTMYEDRGGILWVSCLGGGLNRLDLRAKRFAHFYRDPKNPESLPYNGVSSFLTDRSGKTWIGTGEGLLQFDLTTQRFTIYPLRTPAAPNTRIAAMTEDRAGNLWVGTGDGLYRIAANTGQIKHFFHQAENPQSLNNNSLHTVLVDRDGVLWAGTHGGGLDRFDAQTETFTHFRKDPNNAASLSSNLVFHLIEDRNGALWIATNDGLSRFDRTRGQFENFVHDRRSPHSISHSLVWMVYEDRAGNLWAGTAGGLNQFNANTREFTHYSEKDGLPNNNVMGILEDEQGHLWLGTGNGIAEFDPVHKTFRNFDVTDGLQGKEFGQAACYKNPQGQMFFGGSKGFNLFHPAQVVQNTEPSPVTITACRRYNTDDAEGVFVTEKGMSARPELALSYKNNIISFDFAVLSYRHPEKHQFAYQLEGYSDKWIALGTKHDVTFTNLDPGTYTLRVRGANSDGVWNNMGARLRLVIIPPFWKRWWFLGLELLLLGGMVVGVFRWRVSLLDKRHAQQQAFSRQLIASQEAERKRIAAELHDSLGQRLVIIKNLAFMAMQMNGQVTTTSVKEISEEASNAISEVREISYNLRPYQLDRIGLTKAIEAIFKNATTASTIQFSAQIDNVDGLFPKEQEINFYRIVQESVNNILKHSQATRVKAELKRDDVALVLTVQDNGKGFTLDPNKPRGGFGLLGMQERAELLGGELSLHSVPGQGTTLQIVIALEKLPRA